MLSVRSWWLLKLLAVSSDSRLREKQHSKRDTELTESAQSSKPSLKPAPMLSCKWKDERCPQKLTNFLIMPAPGKGKLQDCTSGATLQASASYTDLPDEDPGDWDTTLQPTPIQGSPPNSPIPNSPAKAKMRMDPSIQASGTVSTSEHLDHIGLNLQSSMPSPPQDNPSFIQLWKTCFFLYIHPTWQTSPPLYTNSNLRCMGVGERVQYIEHRMYACTTIVNDLIDAYKDQSDDNDWTKVKLARRNNVNISGYQNLSLHQICINTPVTWYPNCFQKCHQLNALSIVFTEYLNQDNWMDQSQGTS